MDLIKIGKLEIPEKENKLKEIKIDDEIKNILIPSVFAYRNCWEKDNAFWKRYAIVMMCTGYNDGAHATYTNSFIIIADASFKQGG